MIIGKLKLREKYKDSLFQITQPQYGFKIGDVGVSVIGDFSTAVHNIITVDEESIYNMIYVPYVASTGAFSPCILYSESEENNIYFHTIPGNAEKYIRGMHYIWWIVNGRCSIEPVSTLGRSHSPLDYFDITSFNYDNKNKR